MSSIEYNVLWLDTAKNESEIRVSENRRSRPTYVNEQLKLLHTSSSFIFGITTLRPLVNRYVLDINEISRSNHGRNVLYD